LKPVCLDCEVSGFSNNLMDQTYRGIVTPRDRDRNVFGIEIDCVAEEHDLNRRNDHYQRDARSIVNEMQQFEARDSQHAPQVAS
jgi:hypothetical protein